MWMFSDKHLKFYFSYNAKAACELSPSRISIASYLQDGITLKKFSTSSLLYLTQFLFLNKIQPSKQNRRNKLFFLFRVMECIASLAYLIKIIVSPPPPIMQKKWVSDFKYMMFAKRPRRSSLLSLSWSINYLGGHLHSKFLDGCAHVFHCLDLQGLFWNLSLSFYFCLLTERTNGSSYT